MSASEAAASEALTSRSSTWSAFSARAREKVSTLLTVRLKAGPLSLTKSSIASIALSARTSTFRALSRMSWKGDTWARMVGIPSPFAAAKSSGAFREPPSSCRLATPVRPW